VQLALIAAFAGIAWASWNEIEPLFTFRPTEATVLAANLEQRSGSRIARIDGSPSRRAGFVPAVTYRYEVGGNAYVGSMWARTNTLQSSRAVSRRLRSLTPGSTVTAWYKPSQPSEAVLSRAVNPIWMVILLAIAMFLALASRLAVTVRGDRAVPVTADIPPDPIN
jgi:hypothetical protein